METPLADSEINGYRLRYALRGEGPLAIFAHGLLGSMEQVEPYAGALAGLESRVRLLLYDARGHGHSDGPEDAAGYTWESLGLDMAALAALHGGDAPAIYAGGSMGAATALWVALERPELVRALVLLMPPPLGPDALHGDDERQALQTVQLLATAVSNFGLEQTVELARQFLAPNMAPPQLDETIATLRSQNPRTIAHVIAGLISAPRHGIDEYARIAVPTLILAHEGDGLHPMRSARLLAERIPGACLAAGPEPGYWQDHPAEFLDNVECFLDSLV